jgi:hypothetical protein
MRHQAWFLAIALALCSSRSALAQPTGAPTISDEHFRHGREALALRDYRLALHLFRASQELEPARGKLLNIALCEEKLGLVTAATQHFEQVLPQLAPGDERRALVQQHLAELAPRISYLRVDLASGAPVGARVSFNGAPLATSTLGTEMVIDPGKYVITVNTPDRSERRYDVVMEEGKALAITVEPGVVVSPKAPPREDAPQRTSNRTHVGIFLVSAGAAAVTIGGITGILARIDHDDVERLCPTRVACSPDALRQASAGESLSVISALTLSAGAIGAGVGSYLLLSGGKSRGPSTATATVGLTLLPDGGRLGVRGSF